MFVAQQELNQKLSEAQQQLSITLEERAALKATVAEQECLLEELQESVEEEQERWEGAQGEIRELQIALQKEVERRMAYELDSELDLAAQVISMCVSAVHELLTVIIRA